MIKKRVFAHVFLIFFVFLALAPFLWMFLTSFKIYGDVMSPKLIPPSFTLDNYREIIEKADFLGAFRNSALVAIPTVISVVITSSAAGYCFSKYNFRGKELLFTLFLSTMMVPFAAVVIPLFLTMRDLSMIDSLRGLVSTGLCSTFGIFLMRQTAESIPNDYIDAARVDGAGEFWILFRVIMPLSKAAIATLAVLTFLGSWDSYLWPSVLIRSTENQTLPMFLSGLRSMFFERYGLWSAGSMLTVIPTMVIFIFAARHLVKGLALGGLKG